MVIKDCTEFPHGSHDDIVDALSLALRHLRNNGMAIRKTELDFEEEQRASRIGGKSSPLYEV